MKYLLTVRPKLLPKSKCSKFIEIWPNWYLKYIDFDFDVKNDFYEIYTTCKAQIGPKTKGTQNLLRFETFGISNMPISIVISRMTFITFYYL